MDLDKVIKDFEEQYSNNESESKETKDAGQIIESNTNPLNIIQNTVLSIDGVVDKVQQKILDEASEKINSAKILEKHAESIAKITDKAMEVDTERVSLSVQEKEADNKVRKQEIRNKLIVLNAEAKRLEKEQKQLNKEQKAEHTARNKAAKWDMYKDKLEKMKYTYVPNVFVLSMLLFFDGIRSFFDGLGTVSTSIPVTREWIVNLLGGN